MKNLLFILPIICLSLNLQAQQDDVVTDSERQLTSVEEEFLDAVDSGDWERLSVLVQNRIRDLIENIIKNVDECDSRDAALLGQRMAEVIAGETVESNSVEKESLSTSCSRWIRSVYYSRY